MVAPRFAERMKGQLGAESDAFFTALHQAPPVSIRLHHRKGRSAFALKDHVPWCDNGYYLPERPSFHLDPHWHAGAYYVQEASSMMLDAILNRIPSSASPRVIVDLCAAPGGKSGILASHMRAQDVFIANEVVPARRQVLWENLIKGGYPQVFVTGLAANAFTTPIADIMLIDAPCSGEGMMRKDQEAVDQWSESLVHSCSMLQRNILADAYKGIVPGGILIYSTCSYSPSENMGNAGFIQDELGAEPMHLEFPPTWNLTALEENGVTGYQLYPHRVRGEGLFFAVFQKPISFISSPPAKHKYKTRFERIPAAWHSLLPDANAFSAIPQRNAIGLLRREAEEAASKVYDLFPQAGLISEIGEMKGKDLIPSHFLAMSSLANAPVCELDKEAALDFLERKTIHPEEFPKPGWYLMKHDGSLLGWMKAGGSGWKNHYPMAWRLRQRR